MDISLKGKTALVCGASQGIGAACAQVLAEMGARILLVSRSADKLETVLRALPGSGHQVFACDLSQAPERQKLCSWIQKNAPVHILLNNSGGPAPGPIAEAKADEFVQALQAHVVACAELSQACLPGMKSEKYGRILNIISTSVKVPIPNLGVSNTTRAAVAAWAKTLAGEVASHGITVNSVLPGYTATERLEKLSKGSDETKKQWLKTIPAARFGEPVEIANVVGFLASPAASYVNGVALAVDGGRTGCL